MANKATLSQQDETLYLSGVLDFDTVIHLAKMGCECLNRLSTPVVDFSAVTKSNSAGLLLLTDWQRYAHQQQKTISFKNLPDTLMALAELSGLTELLSLSTDTL